MQEELKPCPWCGVKPNISHDGSFVLTDGVKWGALQCCGTGPEVRTDYMDVAHWKGAAIAAWNERTPVSGEVAEGCKNADMGEFACANRAQCFEPCGELGHSAEHAKPVQGIDHAKLDERAAFEAWAISNKYVTDREDGAYEFTATRLAWQVWQARGQQAGGAGFVILPVSPTSEAVAAIEAEIDIQLEASGMSVRDMHRQDGDAVYAALMAAAGRPA